MVIMIDGAAYGAKAVVAICQHIGDGERLHAAAAGRLNDADIGNIVRSHCIKTNGQLFRIAGNVMGLKNIIGDGTLSVFRARPGSRRAVDKGNRTLL